MRTVADIQRDLDIVDKKMAAMRPPMYQVVLLNDNFTPMDFVTQVLEEVFHKTRPDAVDIMLKVHKEGRGVACVCSRQIAESRVFQVQHYAGQRGFPLQAIMEVV